MKITAFKNKEYESHGNFTWNIFELSNPFIEKLDGSTITRLIYLSTYMDYDGTLIDTDVVNNKKLPLNKKKLFWKMQLGKSAYYDFIAKLEEVGILKEQNGLLKLSDELFVRGTINKKTVSEKHSQNLYLVRLYHKAIKDIYKNVKPRTHKLLSYIFRIIPYVNRKYNIVCFNPLETDVSKVYKMTMKDYCETINCNNQNNSTRLFNELFKLKVNVNGQQQNIIKYVSGKDKLEGSYYIFLNPHVFYAGTDWSKVEVLGAFCENNEAGDKNAERN